MTDKPKAKTKSRSGGRVPTEDERIAAGWAKPLLLRWLQEEEQAVDRLALPGESYGVTIRRIIRGIAGLGPVPKNRRPPPK